MPAFSSVASHTVTALIGACQTLAGDIQAQALLLGRA